MEEPKLENNFTANTAMENSISKLGPCEVCNCTPAKYTCPKCEVKTCSLPCNRMHKKELECDGIRDKTKFIPLKKMTNLDLSSDYRLLEEITRNVENYKKGTKPKCSAPYRELPHHMYKLKQQAKNYKTNIKFLPQTFSKRKQNTTIVHFKTNVIFWHIEWVFVNADNLKMFDHRVAETEKLCSVLQKFFAKQDDVVLQEKLQYYQACDVTGVKVFLKAEQCGGNKFFEADLNESVRENLRNKIIVEHPTFYVVFKDHASLFNVIDADGNSTKTSADGAIVDALLKSVEEEEDSSYKNLLFASEDSDEELSEERRVGL